MYMRSPYIFHFTQVGDKSGPAVVFLHGFLGRAQDWGDVISSFSNEFWCLAVDLPGHGKTVVNGSEETYQMENCATGLVNFLDSLDIGKCDIVAYSMGARLALYMAANFPQRFERVVLESASPGLRTEQERQDRRARDNRLGQRLETDPLEQFLKEWYDQPLFASLRKDKGRFSRLLAGRMDNNKAGLATSLRMMGTGIQPSLWDDLHKIKAHLCLIVGEKDDKFRRIAAEMAPKCPKASVCIVEGAGHSVHWEKTEEYVRIVKSFLLS